MSTILSKKTYSLAESYRIAFQAIRTSISARRSGAGGKIDSKFAERIRLAVTEVNGCGVCSYVHTKVALQTGMSDEEIKKMLGGAIDDVPPGEVAGIMFAQHYADTRGNPTPEAWARVVKVYGNRKAEGILVAVREIMLGNVYGIPLTALGQRLRGRPDPRSSLAHELIVILGLTVLFPVVLVHALASVFLRPVRGEGL